MRIAICLAGYLRTFEQCWPSILKNVIQDHDFDIFIHTYNKLGNGQHGWRFPISQTEPINTNFLLSLPNLRTLEIEDWNDIKYKFENFLSMEEGSAILPENVNSMVASFYKVYKCNELKKQYEKENNFVYDVVIRMRPDIFFEKKVNLKIDKNKILINAYPWGDEDWVHNDIYKNPKEMWAEKQEQIKTILNDRFAAGSSENIDYLADLYNKIYDILVNIEFIVPERILNDHLKSCNIGLEKRILNFYIKRNPRMLVKGVYRGD
jgi:hypothetical protein